MTRRWTNLSALLGLALWLSTPSGAAAQQAPTPDKLNLLVGEIADLSVASTGTTPVRVTSSKPGIVEVTSRNRLIGRSAGVAEIEVAQGSRSRTVEVGVANAEFQSIAVDPPSVVVAVDETVCPRVVARVKGDPAGARWSWPRSCWSATKRLRPAMPISTPSGWSCGGSCRRRGVRRRRWRCTSPR